MLRTDEFKGSGAFNYRDHNPATWQCSDRWAGEGGLMCCERFNREVGINTNKSCCPGALAINLFSLGTKLGSATSITLPLSSTQSRSIMSPTANAEDPELASLLSSASLRGLLPASSSSSASVSPTLGGNPRPSVSESNSSTATIAIATSTALGAVLLIFAGLLIYRCRQRRRRAPKQNYTEEVFDAKEMSPESSLRHEMPTGEGNFGSELSGHEISRGSELPCWWSY